MLVWLANNYKWLFSGLGVAIIGWLFLKAKTTMRINQNISDSNNITQIAGDLNVGSKNDEAKR